MAAISVDDYITRGDSVIVPDGINKRIETLKALLREAEQEGDEPFVEDVAEYEALVGFREDVGIATGGKDFESVTIVPDELFDDYARDYAYEISEIDFLAPFVDWEKFADSLKQDYKPINFGDDLVHVR